jgi:hypothetical protein
MKKIVSETSMKEIRRKIILKNRYDELFFWKDSATQFGGSKGIRSRETDMIIAKDRLLYNKMKYYFPGLIDDLDKMWNKISMFEHVASMKVIIFYTCNIYSILYQKASKKG